MSKTMLLLAGIGLQMAVLAGMLVNAFLPLWTGTEIRLKTVPIDPRSLLRGNYAMLSYEISELPANLLPDHTSLRFGEPLFVSLRQGKEGLHHVESVTLEKPDEGVFIRGRYQGYRGSVEDRDGQGMLLINYGIEAYFAPKEKAQDLESQLRRTGAIAWVMVASDGKPALESIGSMTPGASRL